MHLLEKPIMLNDQFLSISEKLTGNDSKSLTRAAHLLQANINVQTLDEIRNTINTLKKKHSEGYDCISILVVAYVIDAISPLLGYLCNHSLLNGTFPDRMKNATVVPLFKKGIAEYIRN